MNNLSDDLIESKDPQFAVKVYWIIFLILTVLAAICFGVHARSLLVGFGVLYLVVGFWYGILSALLHVKFNWALGLIAELLEDGEYQEVTDK